MKNLPEYLIEAVKPNSRQPNPERMSVTQLGDSPLIRTLWMENWDKIEQDPEDMLWALYGTALDTIVKAHNRTGLVDLKFEYPFDDYTIVGKPDIYYPSTETLVDVKTTSVWTLQNPRKEWTYQLNVYKWLMEQLMPELKVKKLEVHGIGRDWRKNEKLRYNTYPDSAFVVINIPMWDDVGKVIDADIKRHKNFPREECTLEEKWSKPDQYAVMRTGRKSALRVLDSEGDAHKWCKHNDHKVGANGIKIVKRPGEFVRCNQYCSVSSVCPFNKGEKK